jgi:soluble cytochrome b562
MAISDILGDIGKGVATGAKAIGSVAAPIAERTAQVVSGEAPQIDEEKRKQQYALEDQQVSAKAQQLEGQLQMGQKYGTLTPQQQQQYVDAISGLYSHPRHAGVLMEKLRSAIHPNGAYAQGPQAPLPNAVPQGGTAQADEGAREQGRLTSLTQGDDLKKQQTLQSIDWFKKNMLPQFPPEQQASKLNEYIDHINGITQGTEKPPKGMKAMEQGGVFFGIEDQDTGKQYLRSQLEAGGDAPPEAKQMYAEVQKGAADKQKAQDQKEKEAEERQQRQFAHSIDMLGLQMDKSIQMGNVREAQNSYKDAEKVYRTSADLSLDMARNAPAAKAGDQQAMIAILTDHAGGTTKLAGGRLTKPIMDELQNSMPFLEGAQKRWSVDPDTGIKYLTGVVLSPDQVDKMLNVANNRTQVLKESLNQVKSDHPEAFPDFKEPGQKGTGAKKVGQLLPKTGAKPNSSNSGNVIVVTAKDLE